MRAKPCLWNGIEYPSIKVAAEANGLNRTTMIYRLKQGYSNDADLKTGPISCQWNGVDYPTIRAAAHAHYRSPEGMQYLIHRGYTSESDLER